MESKIDDIKEDKIDPKIIEIRKLLEEKNIKFQVMG